MIGPVVIYPSTNDGINTVSQVIQRLVRAKMEPPAPNLLPDLLGRTGTDGGRKAHKHLTVPVADQTRPEAIAQEVKLLGDLSSLPKPLRAV